MRRVLIACLSALALTATLVAPAQAIPTGGKSLQLRNVVVYGQLLSSGTCQIVGRGTVDWFKHPKKKGLTTGHYLRMTVEIQTPAGYGGTLWKTLAKRTTRTDRALLGQGLPQAWTYDVGYNTASGTGEYRTKFTVRVIRDVRPGLDTTAWKKSVVTATIGDGLTSVCVGGPGVS
jgi:hypothetical protein